MTTIIEDRPCACGHFYGNHADRISVIDAEQIPIRQCQREGCPCEDYTPGEPLEGDIDVVARRVVAVAVWAALEFGHVGHETYPELGEHDWRAVAERAIEIAKGSAPAHEDYQRAYDSLTARADSAGEVSA